MTYALTPYADGPYAGPGPSTTTTTPPAPLALPTWTIARSLNKLAGVLVNTTVRYDAQAAANLLAGTVGFDLVAALNHYVGVINFDLNTVCNYILATFTGAYTFTNPPQFDAQRALTLAAHV